MCRRVGCSSGSSCDGDAGNASSASSAGSASKASGYTRGAVQLLQSLNIEQQRCKWAAALGHLAYGAGSNAQRATSGSAAGSTALGAAQGARSAERTVRQILEDSASGFFE